MDSMIPIDEVAPQFMLTDLSGAVHSIQGVRGWIVVLNFWSAECTWCERVDRELLGYLEAWKDKVKVWWVASNANETIDLIKKVSAERSLPTVLLDTHQQVADLYGARTTPHFFVVDGTGKLAYQGAWDDITFRQRLATQVYLPEVIEALRNNQAPKITHTLPYGCALVRSYAEKD